MAKEENITLARRFFDEVYSQGNAAVAGEILGPDFGFYGPAAGIHGPDNFLKFTVPMRNGLLLRFVVEIAIGDGEKVATYSRMLIRHQGEYAGIAPTGRELEIPRIDTFLVSEGRIREVRTTLDHAALLAGLKGEIPAKV
jgi:predicted ester cyclase